VNFASDVLCLIPDDVAEVADFLEARPMLRTSGALKLGQSNTPELIFPEQLDRRPHTALLHSTWSVDGKVASRTTQSELWSELGLTLQCGQGWP
jgi:hypothetical protein